jgi:transposase InsO family protein
MFRSAAWPDSNAALTTVCAPAQWRGPTAAGITQKFTRAYRPQTNGKAERFIQSALREWAYGRITASTCCHPCLVSQFLERSS